jgi:hypothetical protein
MRGLPAWVNKLLSDSKVERYQVYLRRKGRPTKETLRFPLPLLCAIDAGETTGVALWSPSWAVVLEADDEDFAFAKTLLLHLPKQARSAGDRRERATVCIESGFCPSADAVFRAGVYTGLAYANDLTPILIHPNAKAQVFKQSRLSTKCLLIARALQHFNFAPHRVEGDGYFQHASDALGLAFTYLRRYHDISTPDIILPLF